MCECMRSVQSKLYGRDMRPVVRSQPSQERFEHIRSGANYEQVQRAYNPTTALDLHTTWFCLTAGVLPSADSVTLCSQDEDKTRVKIRFKHKFEYDQEEVFFAFTYPYGYEQCQDHLAQLDKAFTSHRSVPPPNLDDTQPLIPILHTPDPSPVWSRTPDCATPRGWMGEPL